MKHTLTLTSAAHAAPRIALALLTSTAMVAPALAADQFAGQDLSVLMISQPSMLDCAAEVAKAFEAETGAKVEITGQGYGNLHDSILAAFAGGTGAYDVVSLAYQWVGEFADPGFLLPLDASLTQTEGMIERTKELFQWQGAQVALPYNGEAMLLFYRTDLFEAAGLTPPLTWDDWNAAAQKLTGEGHYATAIMGLREQALTMWSNRYWGLGGGSLDPDATGKVALDPQIAAAALEQLKTDVTAYSPPGALSFGLPEASGQFLAGNVAMVEMWPTFLGPMTLDASANAAVAGKIAAAPVPGNRPHSGGWGLAVPEASRHQEAAVAFVERATTAAVDESCFASTGKGPVYSATYATGSEYWLPELSEAVASANPRSRGADASRVNDMFDEVVARFLAGELTSEEAALQMQDRLAAQ
ncbi:extracellular solute-binding protein [Arenibacterium sp. LLYu02]|uniref:extracellular solute-binding protein n=1 Tax=Arenibacterium sp. LLYu02 TaxID=3404132 RepID=UPI003B21D89B